MSWLFLDICFPYKILKKKSSCWGLVTTARYFLRLSFSDCCLCIETQLTYLLILCPVTWLNYFINLNNFFADFGGAVLGRHKYCLQIMKIQFSLSNLYIFFFSLVSLSLLRFPVPCWVKVVIGILVHNCKRNMFIFHHVILAVGVPFIRLMKSLAISRRIWGVFCLCSCLFFKTE